MHFILLDRVDSSKNMFHCGAGREINELIISHTIMKNKLWKNDLNIKKLKKQKILPEDNKGCFYKLGSGKGLPNKNIKPQTINTINKSKINVKLCV